MNKVSPQGMDTGGKGFLDSLVSEQQKRELKKDINEIFRMQEINSEGEAVSIVMLKASRKGILDPITVPLSISHMVDVGTRDDVALFFAKEYDEATEAEKIGTYVNKADGYADAFVNRLIAVGLGTRTAYLSKGIEYKRRLFDMRFGSGSLPDIVRLDRTELMALDTPADTKANATATAKATAKAKGRPRTKTDAKPDAKG